jgi:hypothetical protein
LREAIIPGNEEYLLYLFDITVFLYIWVKMSHLLPFFQELSVRFQQRLYPRLLGGQRGPRLKILVTATMAKKIVRTFCNMSENFASRAGGLKNSPGGLPPETKPQAA